MASRELPVAIALIGFFSPGKDRSLKMSSDMKSGFHLRIILASLYTFLLQMKFFASIIFGLWDLIPTAANSHCHQQVRQTSKLFFNSAIKKK